MTAPLSNAELLERLDRTVTRHECLALIAEFRAAVAQEERERCEARLTRAKRRIEALEMQIEDEEAKWADDFGF